MTAREELTRSVAVGEAAAAAARVRRGAPDPEPVAPNLTPAALKAKRELLNFVEAWPAMREVAFSTAVAVRDEGMARVVFSIPEVAAAMADPQGVVGSRVHFSNLSSWNAARDAAAVRSVGGYEQEKGWAMLNRAARAYFEGALTREELAVMGGAITAALPPSRPAARTTAVAAEPTVSAPTGAIVVELEWDPQGFVSAARVVPDQLALPADQSAEGVTP